MNQGFKPPKTETEFRERSKDISVQAAQSMLAALRFRREQAVRPIDQEIYFYERVIKEKTDGES